MHCKTTILGRVRHASAGFLLAVLGGGCEDGTAPAEPEPKFPASAIISDPTIPLSPMPAPGGAALEQVAYVSFLPGSLPSGSRITIRNRRTATSIATDVVGDGLDPMPVPANEGDFLSFVIDTGGAEPIGFTQVVPIVTRPAVVRLEPQDATPDVPLDAKLRVIFSEPMSLVTIPRGTFGLTQQGEPVDGTVEFSADGLEATFLPTNFLLGATEYSIQVSGGIQDSDGSELEAAATATFTTSTLLPFAGVLAFTGDGVTGDGGIRLINADGTNLRTLTPADPNCGICDRDPAWSPTGDRIAFTRLLADGGAEIHVINRDGTNLVRLSPPGGTDDADPTWSPDGRRIAFVHGCDPLDGGSQIYVMNADGSNRVALTPCAAFAGYPTWSPDGSRIAYASERLFGPDIFVVDGDDGGNLSILRDDSDPDLMPAWSPDGSRIVFVRNCHLFLTDPEGTELEQLSPLCGFRPAWSPDGGNVAFTRTPIDEPTRLWIISVDDGRLAFVTEGLEPSWAP